MIENNVLGIKWFFRATLAVADPAQTTQPDARNTNFEQKGNGIIKLEMRGI